MTADSVITKKKKLQKTGIVGEGGEFPGMEMRGKLVDFAY